MTILEKIEDVPGLVKPLEFNTDKIIQLEQEFDKQDSLQEAYFKELDKNWTKWFDMLCPNFAFGDATRLAISGVYEYRLKRALFVPDGLRGLIFYVGCSGSNIRSRTSAFKFVVSGGIANESHAEKFKLNEWELDWVEVRYRPTHKYHCADYEKRRIARYSFDQLLNEQKGK